MTAPGHALTPEGMTGNCPDHRKKTMTPDEIREYYDQHPDLTLATLARMTGRTIDQLKRILQS